MDCPTPFKHGFMGKAEALAALDRQRKKPGSNVSHVYRCQCSRWHLAGIKSPTYTHMRKRNKRRKGGITRRRR